MDNDVRKELDKLQKRVTELERDNKMSRRVIGQLTKKLNGLLKQIRTLKDKTRVSEGNINAIRNSLRRS